MNELKISIGFSPCPNDTFIFDALVNQKIDTGSYKFDPVLEDVQTLNRWAMEKKLQVTKLSYAVVPKVLNNYKILDSGSALGRGVGPLLIGKTMDAEIKSTLVAIPGENTTANFLFSIAYPEHDKKVFVRYDEVEDFVLSGKGLGVIIHENRFTYADKGLCKLCDLGELWETKTGYAIPLGGIVIDRNLGSSIQKDIELLIRQSTEYAFLNYPVLTEYVKCHAREMSEDVMRMHIDLYVNQFSISLGDEGKAAIKYMLGYSGVEKNADIFV